MSPNRESKKRIMLAAISLIYFLAFLMIFFLAKMSFEIHQYVGGSKIKNGELSVMDYVRDDKRLLYLDGEWEFFKDKLIITDGFADAEPDCLISVPGIWSEENTPETGKASYRISIKDKQEDVQIMVAFPGFLSKYSIFVNGAKAEVFSVSPNYMQFVVLRGEGIKTLVIEIDSHMAIGLTVCPVAMDVNNLFRYFFGIRTEFIALLGILVFAFAVFPFVYAQKRTIFRQLMPYFVTGALALLFYVIQTIWYYGILDKLVSVFPLDALRMLGILTAIILFYSMLTLTHSIRPIVYTSRWAWGAKICAAVALVATAPFWKLFGIKAALIPVIFCFLILTILIIITSFRGAAAGGKMIVCVIGNTSLIVGVAVNYISGYSHIYRVHMYVLPICIIIFLFCWNLAISQKRRKEIAALERALTLELEMGKTQAAFLASQIQPHFLYNTLSSIQELCYTDPDQAAKTVVKFSNYLRCNIDFMEYSDRIRFEKELKHIDNYMDIQISRFGGDIVFEKEIQDIDFFIPPLTVQPLVENAIKHGIREGDGRGTVRLTVERNKDWIRIIVSDDGEGFEIENTTLHSLENLRYRLENVLGASLCIESKKNFGTKATIVIPVKEGVEAL